MKNEFYKVHPDDRIWWKRGLLGEWLFSFDRQKVFNMFRDYPMRLTAEQIDIFDSENPRWADFFRDRKGLLK